MNTTFFIHTDIDVLFKGTNLPYYFKPIDLSNSSIAIQGINLTPCYIMQEDRIVYIGNIHNAKNFIEQNKDKVMPNFFKELKYI
jgi:hypothetical protein